MLLVETNNPKEQSTLQQEFSREGNLFAVPIKKTSQINLILERILFEIFGQTNDISSTQTSIDYTLIQIAMKFKNFLENILNLKFSLSIVRQIFQLIKIRQIKIEQYEKYILQLNQHFMSDFDNEELSNSIKRIWDDNDMETMFQDQVGKNNHAGLVLDADLAGIQCGIEPDNQLSPKNAEFGKNANVSISCDIQSSPNFDAKTMHTLKSQIPTSPKFSMTPLSQMNINLNLKNAKLDYSYNYSDQQSNENDISLTQVKDELGFDRSTHSTFYCPAWKKAEDDNKKIIQSLAANSEPTPKKSQLDQSDYIENLSGRVHPVPSFLHNESLKQMIAKEKRQDVRKSNILKKSMMSNQIRKQNSPNQDNYSSNLRMIKFQNKLRKNSKKSITTKKDVDELRQQITQPKQIKQMIVQKQKIQKSIDKNQIKQRKIKQARYSEGSLFRVKEDIEQLDQHQIHRQNLQLKINNLLEQKQLQNQKKMSMTNINTKKPFKSSNFFKSRP